MIRNLFETAWDRWANFHPALRLLLMAAALAALGLLVTKPSSRAFKAWRVERNLGAARQAIAEVHMDEARDLSLTVLRTGDPRIEAFRILEQATAALRDPLHGEIARALMSHPQSNDADRLHGFCCIAPQVALGLLGQAWTTLPPECQQDPQFATLFADRLIAEQRLSEATTVMLAVPEPARTSAVDLRLIHILIASGKSDGYGEAQRLIAAKMPAAPPDLAAWFDLLESIPVPSLQAKLLDPLRDLLQHPAPGAEARSALLLARMDYAANFTRCGPILEAAISSWQQRDPSALAHFLGDLGLYQRLLQTFPPECLGLHPGLFPTMLAAMERSGVWEQVTPLLDSHAARLPKFEDLTHRALAAANTADSAARAVAWNAAMAEAKASPLPTAFLTLERLARDAGLRDEAEQAMVAAIRLGRGPLPLYAALKPLLMSLARQGRDNTLLEICASYLAFEPGNPVLLTQFAYLACLSNVIEINTLLKAMETLATGYPKDLTIQCVLATACLCAGQADQAAATLDRLSLDPDQLAPANRAIFLTTQVLAHRLAKDDPRITAFPWKSLLPSERKKFTELIHDAP